ncbi:DUF927 domain-containing protein [Lederbergia lenta]
MGQAASHEFQNMIYQFANGKGKLRGNIEGSRAISGCL